MGNTTSFTNIEQSGRNLRLLRRKPLPAIIVATMGFFAANAVHAQQEQTAAEKANDQMATLDVTVVTANKREEDVRKVASSISVLGDQQLENISATQLTDYANYVPGLQATSDGTPGQTTIFLRGIAPLSSGATVGTYIDETPVGSSGLYQAATILALDLLPYDIDRVEVLRGPQGTLYGAGSMGGLLKYVTKAPDLNSREFRLGGGISDVEGAGGLGNNVRFGANLPLVEDHLAIRVSYARNKIPGYIDNSVSGEEGINDGEQTSARVALLWQQDDFSLKLSAIRQTIDSDNNGVVALDPITEDSYATDLSNRIYVNEPFKKDIDYYAATLNWDLGWGDFTSASGYSDTTTQRVQDSTIAYGSFTNLGLGLPEPGSSYFDNSFKLSKFTQEFRLASKTDTAFEWMTGFYYTRESGNNTQVIKLNQIDGSPLPSPFDELAGTLAALELPTVYKEKAVFGNASYQFNDRFKLGAGVRYASNDQNFSQNVYAGILLPIAESPGGSDESIVTWSLTPQFQLSDDSLLYAKVATGYQPGGPNVVLPGVPPTVDSSTLTSYEVGLKSAFADNRVILDISAYHIDWKDIQVIASFNGNSGLTNGGKASSDGFEISALFRPIQRLQLGFNAGYVKSELSENFPTLTFPGEVSTTELNTGLKGDALPYVPKLTLSATADYFFTFGNDWQGSAGGGWRWVDDRVAGTTQRQVVYSNDDPGARATTITPPLQLDSYYAVDLYASVSKANWTIRAYLKNATDQRAYTTIGRVDNQLTGVTDHLNAAPIMPRTLGLEVDYRF